MKKELWQNEKSDPNNQIWMNGPWKKEKEEK